MRYKYYQQNIMLPCIQDSRTEFEKHAKGTIILDELTMTCWCDGDIKQIEAIVGGVECFVNGKNIASKLNPARSGTEQPTDRTETFKLINSMQSDYTCANIGAETHPMKMEISKIFKLLNDEQKLRLKTKPKYFLMNFYLNFLK